MLVFYVPDLPGRQLPEAEGIHATRVLRLKPGDAVTLTDGDGSWCRARLTATHPHVSFEVEEEIQVPRPPHVIHIALAPPKNHDRIEWFVEKATEIGIQEISFFLTAKTERKSIQLDRLQKVAIAAMKQSQQAWLPQLRPLRTWSDLLQAPAGERFIAHADPAHPVLLSQLAQPRQHYLVLIGPEGDFSHVELEAAMLHGFRKVSLGPHRLRTETAALVACMMLNGINA